MDQSTRREFLRTATTATIAAGVSAMNARSYAQVKGANERIRIGIIGCGGRGHGAHMKGIQQHAEKENVVITAVADPHAPARQRAAAQCQEWFGEAAREFVSYRDLLALDDIDAVTIASPDHLQTLHLKATAEANKHVYVEKPLSMDLPSLNAACDAVKASGIVCQVGTQLRSMGSFTGVRDLYQSGVLGKVSRIEQNRNGYRPYWYQYLKEIKAEDVDWAEFLHDRPMRPFSSDQYSAWFGYREFSDGPVPQLGAHFIDLVHYITGAEFPTSVVCHGGTYTWKDEHQFTAMDQVQAVWTYPEDFLVSYSTNFGNASGKSFKIFGNEGVMDLEDWNSPVLTTDGVGSDARRDTERKPIEPINRPDHMLNWLQCMRSGETPHASIDAGYQHSVACIMATIAFDTGRRQGFDRDKRLIHEV